MAAKKLAFYISGAGGRVPPSTTSRSLVKGLLVGTREF